MASGRTECGSRSRDGSVRWLRRFEGLASPDTQVLLGSPAASAGSTPPLPPSARRPTQPYPRPQAASAAASSSPAAASSAVRLRKDDLCAAPQPRVESSRPRPSSPSRSPCRPPGMHPGSAKGSSRASPPGSALGHRETGTARSDQIRASSAPRPVPLRAAPPKSLASTPGFLPRLLSPSHAPA